MTFSLRNSTRRADGARGVTPVELFFDLVFVFAIGQLSHHLLADVDLRGVAETVTLTLAVVYAWYMMAWLSNWLSPDHAGVRTLLIAAMLACLLMSSAIGQAFEARGALFVSMFVGVQIVRSAFSVAAFPSGSPQRQHFVNSLIWEIVTGVIWVAGVFVEHDARLITWGAATALLTIGGVLAHPIPGRSSHIVSYTGAARSPERASGVDADHLLERLRLFFLIALGETLITTGNAFAGGPVDGGTLVAFCSAFVGAVALWWCYFQRAEQMGRAASEDAADPGDVAFVGTWTLTLMVLALISISVSDELAIAHPTHEADLMFTLLAFVGAGLFLLAQVLFMRHVTGRFPIPRLVALGALVVLAIATSGSGLAVASIAATAVVVCVAVSDSVIVEK